MHAFSHAEIHADTHATRTAEAAAWRRAREAAPHLCRHPASALRNRVGEALISAGIRLIQPAHLQARIVRNTRISRPHGGLV
ncbi:hypothetical protein ACFRJ1_34220 [Streptomyces sp. NPDC056773]|uniref:hypothetical protein n=1 Tax=unclassified Streptomyces TaxID=2593676 RepID=UPI0020B8955C|nr:hypothetical protein [Streptomyces sp. TBY4]MCP3756273.1 hypothetical protein [Streptomyces sp. TBY4]